MRATAVARVRVLFSALLLPLVFPALLVIMTSKVVVDGGVVEGKVGPGTVDVCVAPVEIDELGSLAPGVANPCVRMNFCTGLGVDSMTQEFCAPID